MKVRRAIAFPLAGAVLVALLSGCTSVPQVAVHEEVGWRGVADLPLAPRQEPAVAWTGEEVLVVGGMLAPPCPPTAECAMTDLADDGAAFDPETGTWRLISSAPRGFLPSSWAFVAGRLFVEAFDGSSTDLYEYDVEADRWTERPTPDDSWRSLIADGDRLIAVDGSGDDGSIMDLALDVSTGEWSELPGDPLGPTFDRIITPTPYGLVLTAKELVRSPGSERPALVIAALYDRDSGEWTRLPDTGQIGGWSWVWTGERMIDAQAGGADGGEVGNWGREYPYGGMLELPSGGWEPLPDAPEPLIDGWIASATGAGRFVVGSGYVFDDAHQSWSVLGRPADAPTQAGPAVWADDVLVVVGGVDWTGEDTAGMKGDLAEQVWTYRPEQ